MVVCLDRPGSVTIDQVRPQSPTGGFTVTDFALRENPAWHSKDQLAEARGQLPAVGFRGARTANLACDDATGRGHELGVQITKTGQGNATSRGFMVAWHGKGRRGRLDVPLAVVLCQGPTADVAACDTSGLLRSS
jgi:hypothetical protein